MTPPGLHIARLTAADAAAAAAVAYDAITVTVDLEGVELEQVLDRYASRSAWGHLLDERAVFGAYRDGRLVGVAAVHESEPGVAYLSMCNVTERRTGIGRALTAARIRHAREVLGCSRVFAHVDAGNSASVRNLAAFGLVPVADDGGVLTVARDLT